MGFTSWIATLCEQSHFRAGTISANPAGIYQPPPVCHHYLQRTSSSYSPGLSRRSICPISFLFGLGAERYIALVPLKGVLPEHGSKQAAILGGQLV
jgi:hypothetical protein